jgi:hypothetical protein
MRMDKADALKKPTLKSLAAQIRRLQGRIEAIEDLIELRPSNRMLANLANRGNKLKLSSNSIDA